MPRSSFKRWKMSMTSALVRESRFPVGSSASRIDGSLMSARAMATRCCCPPRELIRVVMRSVREPDNGQRILGPPAAQGGLQAALVIEKRQLGIFERRGAGQQVEPLKYKADLLVANHGQLVARQLGHVGAVQEVLAAGRVIEAAENVHEGRFAGARRPGHRDKLTGFDVDGHPTQRADLTSPSA